MVGTNGFEPSTSWSRTSGQNHISRCPGVTYGFSGRSMKDKSGQAAESWRLPRVIDSENGLIHNPSVNRTGRARIQLLCDADDNARNCSKSEDYKRSVKSVTIIAVIEADAAPRGATVRENRSEEHTSELQSRLHLVCRLLLEKKKHKPMRRTESAHTSA